MSKLVCEYTSTFYFEFNNLINTKFIFQILVFAFLVVFVVIVFVNGEKKSIQKGFRTTLLGRTHANYKNSKTGPKSRGYKFQSQF